MSEQKIVARVHKNGQLEISGELDENIATNFSVLPNGDVYTAELNEVDGTNFRVDKDGKITVVEFVENPNMV